MTVRNRSLVVVVMLVLAVFETARFFRRRVRFDVDPDFVVMLVANNLGDWFVQQSLWQPLDLEYLPLSTRWNRVLAQHLQ